MLVEGGCTGIGLIVIVLLIVFAGGISQRFAKFDPLFEAVQVYILFPAVDGAVQLKLAVVPDHPLKAQRGSGGAIYAPLTPKSQLNINGAPTKVLLGAVITPGSLGGTQAGAEIV